MKIEIISGSKRNPSLSYRIAKNLFDNLKSNYVHEVGFINLQDINLPFVEHIWNKLEDVPTAFKPIAERIFDTDAFIICSPEYNGSYAPAMKNLFDHFPKQKRKAFGIVTSSDGALGGMRAAQQLLQLVPALFGIASPKLLIVPKIQDKLDEHGKLTDSAFNDQIELFLAEFLWLAQKIQSK